MVSRLEIASYPAASAHRLFCGVFAFGLMLFAANEPKGQAVLAQAPADAIHQPQIWKSPDGTAYHFMPLGCPLPRLSLGADALQLQLQAMNASQLSLPQTPFPNGWQLPSFTTEQSKQLQLLMASEGGQGLLTDGNGRQAASNDLLSSGNATGDLSVLESMGPAAKSNLPGANHGADKPARHGVAPGEDPHAEVFANGCYPSAVTCAKCHQKIYDEWRVSAHAYATISPMFQKLEQAITQITQGTIGTFCIRCHAPVATQENFPRYASYVDAPSIVREGITCVACHRVKERYGRSNGERRIEPGDVSAPIYGSIGGDGVARAIANRDHLKIKLDANDKKPGQVIHREGIVFEQISHSAFCTSCHQVAVYPGIALEVVWAQYRASPAFKNGVTCQDCHMGLVPGKAMGYAIGPAAEMSGKTIESNRKHSNHMFFGPGQSIAHPALFPHNEKSLRWSLDQWLEYDWRGGWGTAEFEKALADKVISCDFPKAWQSVDERQDARKVLNENMQLLDVKKAASIAVLSSAAHVDGPFFHAPPQFGQHLNFEYVVHNKSDGHNMPSGSLGAQPQLWLNVVLTGPDGKWLWESGYLDGNGDLADQHSLQVTAGLIRPDLQLFNLQTKFLITGVKGTDREMYLPLNVDLDQLLYLRPGAVPVSVLNHPPSVRMEAHSIPPLGTKRAKYRVPADLISQRGIYRISTRIRSRMEPVYFMRFCNATPEMERRMLEQTLDVAQQAVEFEVR